MLLSYQHSDSALERTCPQILCLPGDALSADGRTTAPDACMQIQAQSDVISQM